MQNSQSAPIEISRGDFVQLVGRSSDGQSLIPRRNLPVTGEFEDCACPHCRHSLSVRVTPTDGAEIAKPRRRPPTVCKFNKGFVALMYGSSPQYMVGALVTGWSLQQHTSLPIECRILLCTDDVPVSFRDLLSSVWTIQLVEYINKASPWFYWDYQKSRFKQVFTKLRVLRDFANVFRKIILLDLDLLIRGEVDSLFDLPAPAAMVRGQSNLGHGEIVPVDAFFTGSRQTMGINCGVMLVEPDAEVFDKMLEEVEQHYHPEHWPSHGPEQDYLSRYYNAFSQWYNMSCRYNYQVHLTQFGSLEWHTYNTVGHPDVSIFHFSGRLVKPWSLLLDFKVGHNMSYDQILTELGNMTTRAAVAMEEAVRGLERKESGISDEPKEDVGVGKTACPESHFCNGTGSSRTKKNKCYLEREIHPSWSEADTASCIEWLEAFKQADEALGGKASDLLTSLWNLEHTNNPFIP